MKQKIIKLAMKLGGLQLAKFITRKTPRIFMYHSFSEHEVAGAVSKEKLEWQMGEIKKNFNPITLLELSTLISSNKPVPNNTIVITIDDGYKNFYDIAYPILKRYNVPATFFVTTGFINGDLWLWPDQLKWLLKQSSSALKKVTLSNQEFSLAGTFQQNWQVMNDFFLSVTDELKHNCIQSLAEQLSIVLPTNAPKQYEACTWQQLQEMQDWGVEIGGHTVTHPSLGQINNQQAESEIMGCLQEINKQLGERKRTFCYPNGAPNDYNEKIKKIVKVSGFVSAVTAFNDSYNLNLPFAWRRFDGGNSALGFKKSLYGIEHLGNKMKESTKCNY